MPGGDVLIFGNEHLYCMTFHQVLQILVCVVPFGTHNDSF